MAAIQDTGGYVDTRGSNQILLGRHRQRAVLLADNVRRRDVSVREIAQGEVEDGHGLWEQFGHILLRNGFREIVVERSPRVFAVADFQDIALVGDAVRIACPTRSSEPFQYSLALVLQLLTS